jgi:hypothetical protein
MPKTKNTILPQNLDKYKVYINDSSVDSNYFRVTNLPPMFTGGRNSFLIGGSPYLKVGSQILIEILDADGNTVFLRPILNYIEGKSRLVSVEIYDTTAVGFATITFVGVAETLSDGTPVPENWKNKYNVRWTKRIQIEPSVKNTSKIILESTPTAFVSENRFYNVTTSSYTTSSVLFTASLTPTFKSAVPNGYVLTAIAPTSFSADYFTGYVTGSLIVDNQTASLFLPITNILNTSTSFSSGYQIKTETGEIIDKILLQSGSYNTLVKGRTVDVTSSAELKYSKLDTTDINIPISYANIRIVNLSTVSGEIAKVRVYSKVTTNISEYKLIADVPVSTDEILVSGSLRGNIPIGDFYRSPLTTNWYASGLETSSNVIYPISGSPEYYDATVTATTMSLHLDDNTLINSLYAAVPIDGSVYSGSFSGSGYFIGNKQPITLFPTTEYTFELDGYYRKVSGSYTLSNEDSKVDIYIVGVSGSSMITRNPLGQLIGQLKVEPNAHVQWFQNQQFNFNPLLPEEGGKVGIRLVVSNGFWNFSNISLKAASDINFAPDEIQILVPNTEYFNSYLQHKIEFFDINSNSTNLSVVTIPTFFTGSNIDLGTLP